LLTAMGDATIVTPIIIVKLQIVLYIFQRIFCTCSIPLERDHDLEDFGSTHQHHSILKRLQCGGMRVEWQSLLPFRAWGTENVSLFLSPPHFLYLILLY
jgi:hypothetical protein